MKNLHSALVSEFELSLEAGVIDRAEIIRWADNIMLTEEYDDNIAEICMSMNKTDKEIEEFLRRVAGSTSNWEGTRRMLGRMYGALTNEPDRIHEFTQFLDRLWIRNGHEVPEDLSFIIGLEEDYQLAEEGQWASIDGFRSYLLENLSRYQTNNTEQDVPSDGHKPTSHASTTDPTTPADAH